MHQYEQERLINQIEMDIRGCLALYKPESIQKNLLKQVYEISQNDLPDLTKKTKKVLWETTKFFPASQNIFRFPEGKNILLEFKKEFGEPKKLALQKIVDIDESHLDQQENGKTPASEMTDWIAKQLAEFAALPGQKIVDYIVAKAKEQLEKGESLPNDFDLWRIDIQLETGENITLYDLARRQGIELNALQLENMAETGFIPTNFLQWDTVVNLETGDTFSHRAAENQSHNIPPEYHGLKNNEGIAVKDILDSQQSPKTQIKFNQ